MTNKETKATPEQEAELKALKEKQEKEAKVAKEIQDVLESNEFALQPFLQFSEFGIVPRVRLVELDNASDEQGTDIEEAEGVAEQDGTSTS